jgi:hypothetical protein
MRKLILFLALAILPFVYAAAPSIDSLTINVTSPTTSESLNVNCAESDADGDNVTLWYEVYVNGSLNASGTTANRYCFQDSAEPLHSCNIGVSIVDPYDYTGVWNNPWNMYDEDWNTYGNPYLSTTTANFTYTAKYKSYYNTTGATWRIKRIDGGITNTVLPDDCICSFCEVKVRHRYTYNETGALEFRRYVTCHNGSDYEVLDSDTTLNFFSASEGIREEGINWSYMIINNNVSIYSIPSSQTSKGDNWTIKCLADDGTTNSSWSNLEVIIQNSAPVVTSVNLSQNSGVFSTSYATSDSDGDNVTDVSIKWYIEGVYYPIHNNKTSVSSSVEGTYIASVAAYDGTSWGNFVNSSGLAYSVGGSGGGGGTTIVYDGICGLGIVKPNTKEIFMFGNSGTASFEMIFYNNMTVAQFVEFEVLGVAKDNCNMQFRELQISGESYAHNIVTCQMGYKYGGFIHVEFGQNLCDTDISLQVDLGSGFWKWFGGVIAGTAGGLVILAVFLVFLVAAVLVAKYG